MPFLKSTECNVGLPEKALKLVSTNDEEAMINAKTIMEMKGDMTKYIEDDTKDTTQLKKSPVKKGNNNQLMYHSLSLKAKFIGIAQK